jgi:hypothetical protein
MIVGVYTASIPTSHIKKPVFCIANAGNDTLTLGRVVDEFRRAALDVW